MPALPETPATDWLLGTLLFVGMLVLLALAERLYRRYPHRTEALRKFIHIATGVAVLPAPWLFTSWVPIFIITAFFALANWWAIQHGKLKSIHEVSRASLGTFYYPLSYAVLLLLFWQRQVMILSISFALMAFGDAIAGIIAGKVQQRKILPLSWDKKSLQGSVAMFACSAFLVALGLALFRHHDGLTFGSSILVAIAIGLLATAAEAISYRGSDNLTVPLLSALGLLVILKPETQIQFLFGEALALTVVSAAFTVKALDLSGALAGFIIGTFVFGIGGWSFAIPMLLFFIVSSLLSKLPQQNATVAEKMIAKGDCRDAVQVLANGLLPTLTVITSLFIKNETAFLLYLGGLAAATADTWATEIGLRLGKQPRSILTGKLVAPGTSGGITLVGVLGAILGAALVALAGYLSYRFFKKIEIHWQLFIGVTIGGIIAQFIDSLLGATLQRRNRCVVCGKITERGEHCGQPANHASGWRWLDNDVVNIACGVSGMLIVAAISL
ncbi:MAG: DUF92 domain-containing protein [bacterium]